MKRVKLLLAMLALAAVAAAAVVLGSPYAPVIAPAMEIEEIWAIEDAREQSDKPLVTALENHGMPLGYDAQENTFYCTLGMDNADEWPDIHLTAPGAKGVRLTFVDDYSYDWCADAIRDGYSYEVLAYTETEYAYFYIVFTSLPIIALESGEAIPPHEDVPVGVTVSWNGEPAMRANGRAHKRGDTSLRLYPKNGLKVEFTRSRNGTGKIQTEVPYLGLTDGMLLLSCAVDHQMIRDRLSWDMFNGIVREGEPFGEMKSQYVELFVNNEYQGAYLMMKPYRYETEMAKLGQSAPAQDSYYRVVGRSTFEFDRPVMQDHRKIYYEQHYAPAGMEPFDSLKPDLDLIKEPSNEKFSEMVVRYLDIDSVLRYMLLVHACGMMDNAVNNINIWAHQTESGVRYYFNPWDLDVSWGLDDEENAEILYYIELFNRMVELDCGGVVRDRLKAIWQDMRERAFNQDYLDRLVERYELELNASCAYYRNAVKWGKVNQYLDMYNIYSYALARFDMMDRRIGEITSEELRDRHLRIGEYETQVLGPLDEAMKQEAEIKNSAD